MTEKHTPVAWTHEVFDVTYFQAERPTVRGKDFKPLYSAKTVEQLESEVTELRKQVEELRRHSAHWQALAENMKIANDISERREHRAERIAAMEKEK